MKLILPVFASLVLLTGSTVFAENCSSGNMNDPNHCCSRPDHSCVDGNGCHLAACASESGNAVANPKGAAPTSTYKAAKEADKAINYNPENK